MQAQSRVVDIYRVVDNRLNHFQAAFANMDHLRLIVTFARAAEAGSFSKAARTLGVTPQAVSAQIRQLEQQVGVRLFYRTTRSINLTEEGRAFHERCRVGMETIQGGLDVLRDRTEQMVGTVRLALPYAISYELVAPLMGRFLDRYPQIRVDMLTLNQLPDVVEHGVDVGIIGGELPSSSLVARKAGAFNHVLCASPAYLDEWGVPDHVDALRGHRCVLLRHPRTGRLWPWTFQSGGDIVTLNPEGALSVQDAESQHRAVLHGAGIGQIASYYAAPHIRAGRLRPVSIGYVSRQVDVHLYLPQRDHIPLRCRALADYLLAGLKRNPDLVPATF